MRKSQRQALFLAIHSGTALLITLAAINVLSRIFPQKIFQASLLQLLRIIWPLLAIEFGLCLLGIVRFIRSVTN